MVKYRKTVEIIWFVHKNELSFQSTFDFGIDHISIAAITSNTKNAVYAGR